MKYEHKELIHEYLTIDRRIKRIEERIEVARIEFEAQSYHGRMDFDVMGVFMKGFKVDTKVCNYVDSIIIRERKIMKYKRKKHYFSRYVSSLDQHTYLSLKRRYGSYWGLDEAQELGHDLQVLDEILEIEEAISHEFNIGCPQERENDMVAVEMNDLRPDTLEQSFNAMLEKIGVSHDVTS